MLSSNLYEALMDDQRGPDSSSTAVIYRRCTGTWSSAVAGVRILSPSREVINGAYKRPTHLADIDLLATIASNGAVDRDALACAGTPATGIRTAADATAWSDNFSSR